MPKDLFSNQSKTYARYRPTYPQELFNYIFQFIQGKNCAWDCATGNGQAANILADHFEKVEATDISEAQIANAIYKPNIHYQICPAEKTPFADNSFDLITVATAYHWLNWKEFYREASRVGKQNAVVAVWAYNRLHTEDNQVEKVFDHLYNDITHAYWEPERDFVNTAYANVEFEFDPLPSRDFDLKLSWNKQHFLGYLESWSATQNYKRKNGASPIDLIKEDLDRLWDDKEKKVVHFPLFVKMGRIVK